VGCTVSIDYVCHDFFRSEIWEMIWGNHSFISSGTQRNALVAVDKSALIAAETRVVLPVSEGKSGGGLRWTVDHFGCNRI
jgi:hypothetical protein